LVSVVFVPLVALAVNPAITSFTVSPASGPSGYFFAFLWSLENAFGSSFLIPCIQGIKLRYSNGSALACGTRIASQVSANDGLGIKIINIGGNQASVTARVFPKDSYGKDYDAGGQTVYISVSPNTQPIEKFTTSTTTTVSGSPVTISWSSTDLDGVNLSIECKPEIKASSPSYTAGLYLPCGKPAFQTDLSKSGSLALNFNNSSIDTLPYTLTLFPAMAPGVYNAVYPAAITINVASDVVPDPVVNYFKTSAPSTIDSDRTMPISWSTENTQGVNLKIPCAEGITATSSKNTSLLLPCDSYAFADDNLLPSSGSLDLFLKNNGDSLRTVTINLIPAFKAKTGYDVTRSKTINVDVRSRMFAQTPTASPTVAPATTVAPPPAPPKPLPPVSKPAPLQKPAGAEVKPVPTAAPEEKFMEPAEESKKKTAPKKQAVVKNADEIAKLLTENKYVETAELVKLNSGLGIYDVVGYRDAKLFNAIPVRLKIKIILDAVDGEVLSVKFPWWSFLAKY